MTDQDLQKIAEDYVFKFAETDSAHEWRELIVEIGKQVRDAQKKKDESLVWLSRYRKSEEKLRIAREALKLIFLRRACHIAKEALERMGGECEERSGK